MSQNFRFGNSLVSLSFFDVILHFNQLLPVLYTSSTPGHRPESSQLECYNSLGIDACISLQVFFEETELRFAMLDLFFLQ